MKSSSGTHFSSLLYFVIDLIDSTANPMEKNEHPLRRESIPLFNKHFLWYGQYYRVHFWPHHLVIKTDGFSPAKNLPLSSSG